MLVVCLPILLLARVLASSWILDSAASLLCLHKVDHVCLSLLNNDKHKRICLSTVHNYSVTHGIQTHDILHECTFLHNNYTYRVSKKKRWAQQNDNCT